MLSVGVLFTSTAVKPARGPPASGTLILAEGGGLADVCSRSDGALCRAEPGLPQEMAHQGATARWKQ